jgi:hypothetical protein
MMMVIMMTNIHTHTHNTNAQIAKEIKLTPFFGQITRIQEKLDAACKQNASK